MFIFAKVDHNSLSFRNIQLKIIDVTSSYKVPHLHPVETFIIITYETLQCGIVREFNHLNWIIFDTQSFVNKVNKSGDRTQPCGAPAFNVMEPDVNLPIRTLCGLSSRKSIDFTWMVGRDFTYMVGLFFFWIIRFFLYLWLLLDYI